MKRFTIALTALLLVTLATAQTPQNQKNAPAQTPQAQQPATPAAPTGPKIPQAKTQEELKAYQAVAQITDPAQFEAGVAGFIAKYPDSELNSMLYQHAMMLYQRANNADKVVEMGRKALIYNPNDPVTLASLASILGERTRTTDLDKDERVADTIKFANLALQNIDNVTPPPNATPEQIAGAKAELRSVAYGAIGMANFTKQDYASAETNFQKSIDVFPQGPDPAIYLRMALAQDKQGKFKECAATASKALQLAQPGTVIAQLAQQERDRATKLANAPKPPAPASPVPETK